MSKPVHERVEGFNVAGARRVILEPFAENRVEGFVLGLGNLTSFFNQVRVGRQSDVFHENSVHYFRVNVERNTAPPAAALASLVALGLRTDTDDRHEAAGCAGFFAVAEEEVSAAGGA